MASFTPFDAVADLYPCPTSSTCDWAVEQCHQIGTPARNCQRLGCLKYVHHLCSIQWASKNNIPEGTIATLCRDHHPYYKKYVAAATATTTAPSSVSAEASAINQSSTETAATIASAVAAALVAAGIGSKGEDTKKAKAANGKNGGKGKNFSQAEIDCVLELIQEHMPLLASQWQTVADEHAMFYPNMYRDVEGHRCKFNALASKKVPTGDPYIPPDVKKAKQIRANLSKVGGLKTGSPEKLEINFSRVNSKGGALEEDSVDFSNSNFDDFKDSEEFVGSESEGDNNKDEDDEDNEDMNVARSGCPKREFWGRSVFALTQT